MGKVNYFLNKYIKESTQLVSVNRSLHMIQQTPRLVLEPLIISSLVFTILSIIIFSNQSAKDIVPILALLAAASFRILSSINKLIGCIQQLDFNKVISENIVTKVNEFKNLHDDFMTSEDLCLLKREKA